MQTTSAMPASTASRIASAAPGGGTKMTLVFAPVAFTACATVSKTGTLPSNFSPPRPGVTPATTCVPYSIICLAWKRARAAVMPWTSSLRVLADEDAHCCPPRADARATTFCAPSAMVVAAWMARPLSLEDLSPELHVRPLEPHDERHLQAELLGRGDDAVRDDVALHDAAEDVDEDRLHLRALEDHLEGLGDLLLVGAAADVEEVRRRDAVAPPKCLMMSIVAIARPAPLTRQPTLPSSDT